MSTRWEYIASWVDSREMDAKLREYSEKGWELVSVVTEEPRNGARQYRLFFKRPKE